MGSSLCGLCTGREREGGSVSLIIGIDPSLTSTGIVVLRDGQIETAATTKNRPELGTIERVRLIKQEITTLDALSETPDLFVIEGFSFASKGRSVFDIAYLGWRIREDLEYFKSDFGIPWIEVPPTQLKKFATGKGNTNKEIILQQVYKRWNYETDNNNIADAFVLAKIGEAYFKAKNEIEQKLMDFQFEVIADLLGDKPKKSRKKVTPCD